MEKIQTSTLRPGLLVSLKTSVIGNVSYAKTVLESEHKTEAGEEKAKWETTRVVTAPEEFEAAKKARSQAADKIRAVCSHSAFGLLCPEAAKSELEKAMYDARQIIDAFNATATLTRVSIFLMTGRIAPDDVEAVKAINSEVRDLLDAMAEGVKNVNVKAIREAANKARDIGQMLDPAVSARVRIAIDEARAAAKKIAKAGAQAAQEIDTAAIRKITEQRTAFLDLDEAGQIGAVDAAPAPALDLEGGGEIAKPAEPSRTVEA